MNEINVQQQQQQWTKLFHKENKKKIKRKNFLKIGKNKRKNRMKKVWTTTTKKRKQGNKKSFLKSL